MLFAYTEFDGMVTAMLMAAGVWAFWFYVIRDKPESQAK